MFDIFTLLYEEAKELISKWFYRFPKEKRKNKGLGRYFTPSPNGKKCPSSDSKSCSKGRYF